MAKLASVQHLTAAAPAVGSRAAEVVRELASLAGAPVEALGSSANVAYQSTDTLLQESSGRRQPQGRSGGSMPVAALVGGTESHDFAAMLANRTANDDWPQAALGMGEASLHVLHGHAAAIYETNYRIALGTYEDRGKSINLRL
jgi:hypothetical protein